MTARRFFPSVRMAGEWEDNPTTASGPPPFTQGRLRTVQANEKCGRMLSAPMVNGKRYTGRADVGIGPYRGQRTRCREDAHCTLFYVLKCGRMLSAPTAGWDGISPPHREGWKIHCRGRCLHRPEKRTDEMFGWMVSSPTMENGKWNLIRKKERTWNNGKTGKNQSSPDIHGI
ncbi:hypothetical protein [Acetivibrio sp. MSJd-27]|uniref:hypothetical protein n=1 Tax=Acetivibrio sp. MSJd-27 TaxID=2841523 RepID=UPI001C11D002|nr:hypothetical protein [Acetivibrio sp. MSJd-27]MBU5449186.1 hypothetical protein [Acetivibrio sp. MSJd-27]